jgi:hypothetical protein
MYRDGIRFARANENRQIPLACGVLEDDNPVLRHQTYTNAINNNFDHCLFLICPQRCRATITALVFFVRGWHGSMLRQLRDLAEHPICLVTFIDVERIIESSNGKRNTTDNLRGGQAGWTAGYCGAKSPNNKDAAPRRFLWEVTNLHLPPAAGRPQGAAG